MFASVSVWGWVLGGLSAMVVGMIWYSPFLFGKQWAKAMGISDKAMNENRMKVMPILLLASFLTAYALSLLMVYLQNYTHYGWYHTGLLAGLLAWAGFAGTAIVVHGVFEPKRVNKLYIDLGNRLVTLVVMGLIIGAFLK